MRTPSEQSCPILGVHMQRIVPKYCRLVSWPRHCASTSSLSISINAGALTHTSIAILDALTMFNGPIIEIHITNVYARESFRHKSYISPVSTGIIAGLGINSYILGINAINKILEN